MDDFIRNTYERLRSRWGPQYWWPAQSRLEMMIGAILTQNTAWSNVERAIENLLNERMIALEALDHVSRDILAKLIRPSGYFNQKAEYIKFMVHAINHRFHESLDCLFSLDTPTLRRELLSWKGIGPETADSILLYAGKRPVFVVDAYTKRFLVRHGWCREDVSYNELARLFTDHLPEDAELFNEYHALIVRLGKEYCKSKAQCTGCPLELLLPED